MSDVDELFQALEERYLRIWHVFKLYEGLYLNSERAVDLLNETAPSLFGYTQQIFLDYLVLEIGKLLDSAGSGQKKNLSLERLEKQLEEPSKLKDELRSALEEARSVATELRTVRNKRIAHTDLRAHRSDDDTLGYSVRQIREALHAIREWMNKYQRGTGKNTTAYEHTIIDPDFQDLVNDLRRARDYKQLVEEGEISEMREMIALTTDPDKKATLRKLESELDSE